MLNANFKIFWPIPPGLSDNKRPKKPRSGFYIGGWCAYTLMLYAIPSIKIYFTDENDFVDSSDDN